jgi:non-specific protein-tyrosine kinase
MAAMGDRVVLVEADMHRDTASDLNVELSGGGLSAFLIGKRLDDVLVEVPVGYPDDARTLTVLPSGQVPPNPSELLESERMHQLMIELEERFDLVILDSAPLPLLSDATALVGHASGAVVVAALGKTRAEDVREVAKQMALLGGEVLGLVANLAPSADPYYYGYPYGDRT